MGLAFTLAVPDSKTADFESSTNSILSDERKKTDIWGFIFEYFRKEETEIRESLKNYTFQLCVVRYNVSQSDF